MFQMMECLEGRQMLSADVCHQDLSLVAPANAVVMAAKYDASKDIAPVAPSNVSAAVVTVKGVKMIQFKWTDNSPNEDWFDIYVASGKNPIGNVWSIKYMVATGHKTQTGERIIVNIPYIGKRSWKVASYRDTPATDIYRWSGAAPMLGCYVK